jgi:hypothetical protein
MPAPRILQAFIPFQVVTRAFDKGRSPIERASYGLLTLVFAVALAGGIIRAVGGESAITYIIRYGIIWLYALVQLYLMGYAAISFTRQGIALGSTNRLKSIGYCALGVTCGILAVALTIMLGYVITQQY